MMKKRNWPLFWVCLMMMMVNSLMIIVQMGVIEFPSPGYAITLYAVIGLFNLGAIIYLARMLKQIQRPH
jgi:hypothetical protein